MTPDLTGLEIPDSKLLVWNTGHHAPSLDEEVQQVAAALRTIDPDLHVLLVPPDQSLEALDEDAMRRIGWVRA